MLANRTYNGLTDRDPRTEELKEEAMLHGELSALRGREIIIKMRISGEYNFTVKFRYSFSHSRHDRYCLFTAQSSVYEIVLHVNY